MSSNFKIKPRQHVEIQSGEVHIWLASLLDNEKDITYYVSVLSRDEHERAKSFRFSKDEKQFTIARGILRCLLANYLKVLPQNIEIAYGLWGKPCLSQEHSLRFNVTHSGDYALYAVTLDFEVGIDLEHMDNNIFELENMATNIFSNSELIYWKSLKHDEQINYFFKAWACKEAFLKALGKGWLAMEKQMVFTEIYDFKKKSTQTPSKEVLKYPYCFDLISEYASAIFIDGPCLRPLYFNWNQPSLIKYD